VLNQLDLLCKLDHSNLLPLLGVTIESDLTMSLVYPWMEKGNAQQYVQDKAIDPRPLVCYIKWQRVVGVSLLAMSMPNRSKELLKD